MHGKMKKGKISKVKMLKMKTSNEETIKTPKVRRHGNECRLK